MICYSYSHLPLLTFKIFVCYETEVKWRFRIGVWSVLSQKLIPWSVVLKTRHKDMIKIYVDCWCLPCLTSPQDQQLQLAKWNNSPEILSFYAVYTKKSPLNGFFSTWIFFGVFWISWLNFVRKEGLLTTISSSSSTLKDIQLRRAKSIFRLEICQKIYRTEDFRVKNLHRKRVIFDIC